MITSRVSDWTPAKTSLLDCLGLTCKWNGNALAGGEDALL